MRLDTERLTAAIEAGFNSVHAPRIVEALLLFAIALQLWSIVRTATATTSATITSAAPSATHDARRRFTQSDVSLLLGAHLFGESTASNELPTPALAPSAFKLVGLYVPRDGEAISRVDAAFTSPTDSKSNDGVSPLEWARKFFGETLRTSARPGAIAWLSLSGAPGQRVQVGDAIGGGKVVEIRDDGVTLDLAGRRARVAYPENPYVAMFRGESDQVSAVADADSIPPELASKLLRFQPALGPSGLAGFRLYPGSDAQAFVKAGLHAGDVLEAIDGTAITAARDMVPLLRAVRDSKPVQLRLRRASRSVDLRLFRASADSRKLPTPVRRSDAPSARPGSAPAPARPQNSINPGATSP